jgi:CDP-paratose 2-epimerase
MKPSRFGDLYYFVCDISKAKAYLGWSPTVDPKTGITNTINWIKDNIELFGGLP